MQRPDHQAVEKHADRGCFKTEHFWDIDTLMQSWRIALLKGTIDTINVNKNETYNLPLV
jgi:hypothetical protein